METMRLLTEGDDANHIILNVDSKKGFYAFFRYIQNIEEQIRDDKLAVCHDAGNRCILGSQVDGLVRVDAEILLKPISDNEKS